MTTDNRANKIRDALLRVHHAKIPPVNVSFEVALEEIEAKHAKIIDKIPPASLEKMPVADLAIILDKPSSVNMDKRAYHKARSLWGRKCKKWDVPTGHEGVSRDKRLYNRQRYLGLKKAEIGPERLEMAMTIRKLINSLTPVLEAHGSNQVAEARATYGHAPLSSADLAEIDRVLRWCEKQICQADGQGA